MKAFIENAKGTFEKKIHDEKTLNYIKSIRVARAYPYPYGFILNTTSEDQDNVDVFILTDQNLKSGDVVEIEPIALMEQFEKSWDIPNKEEVDHNVIAVIKGENQIHFNENIKQTLNEFVLHVFDNIQINKTKAGHFLGKDQAIKFIESKKD